MSFRSCWSDESEDSSDTDARPVWTPAAVQDLEDTLLDSLPVEEQVIQDDALPEPVLSAKVIDIDDDEVVILE